MEVEISRRNNRATVGGVGADHRSSGIAANDRMDAPAAGPLLPDVAPVRGDARGETRTRASDSQRMRKLHDEIFEALPDDFVRRMLNWVRSFDGDSVATSRFDERVDNTREEHPIPTLLGEAVDTDRAIRELPQRYQEVIACFWMYTTRPLEWMATATPRLRVWKLGKASFREWLEIGHERLQLLIAKQTAKQAERGRESAEAQR